MLSDVLCKTNALQMLLRLERISSYAAVLKDVCCAVRAAACAYYCCRYINVLTG